jgi:glycosyltransferase involved in cell wall biosynthesis
MRILYLPGSYVPPPRDQKLDRVFWLSAELEGDVLQDVWFSRPEQVEEALGAGSYPTYRLGRFQYHFLLGKAPRGLRGRLALAWFWISEGRRIYRRQPFDCIVTYAHTLPGVCGAILKFLTGAKLIVEIVAAPDKGYASESSKRGFLLRLKQLYSDVCLHISLRSCDRTHLFAPALIAGYKSLRSVPKSVFPEWVAVSQVPRHPDSPERYILLVGAPWRRKGVDVLIRAFQKLAPDFPQVKLRLLGHYPDREVLDVLIAGSPQIEILKARPLPEALEVISRAAIFALPSRCEGTPRVVLEAMAAGVPVVGSDVDGIPSYVRDGENGFLVPVNDADALADRLRLLLSDEDLRAKMGAKAYEMAHSEFSEQAYVARFARMVAQTVGDREGQRRAAGAGGSSD